MRFESTCSRSARCRGAPARRAAARRSRRPARATRRPVRRSGSRRIAEKRGVSVEQLKADIKARLLARIDAAEKAGRISPERATSAPRPRQRGRASAALASTCGHGWRGAACCAELRHSSASTGNSSARSCRGTRSPISPRSRARASPTLEAAMLAPAEARLAKAVAAAKITQARADMVLDRLGKLASRIATREFPT